MRQPPLTHSGVTPAFYGTLALALVSGANTGKGHRAALEKHKMLTRDGATSSECSMRAFTWSTHLPARLLVLRAAESAVLACQLERSGRPEEAAVGV